MTGHTDFDYTGETALITGSTKGIGRGIARSLAEAGANVAVTARTESDVEETVSELRNVGQGEILGHPADVAETDAVDALVEATAEELGAINLLVNNAAVWPREESLLEAPLEDWDYAMHVNLRAQFYCAQQVAKQMVDQGIRGSIVNVTSQTGDRRAGGRGIYGITKTAVNGLTWRMAHDLATHGIRMNAVSTDVTSSAQLRYEAETVAEGTERSPKEILEKWGKERPIGRLGNPGDISDAVMFLGSDRASYVVGTILRVSGGGNLQ